MREYIKGLLIWAAVFLFFLALYFAVNAGLEGFSSEPWCNTADGSCYP